MKTISIILAASLAVSALMADGATLYKKCASCHGVNGEKAALGKSKVISDMNVTQLETALNGYKDGSYGGPMKGLMKGQVMKLSTEEVTTLSTYIATLGK